MQRRQTTTTHVGSVTIGSDSPIRVQSMTTTNTNDTEACISQALRIIRAGGELVRLTTQGVREAENMRSISDGLKQQGIMTPLVADVHFNARVADVAALYCEKVRINPGNYVDPARTFRQLEYTDVEYAQELQKIEARLVPFINICREHHTAIRIGVNHGSLSDRIMSRYGDTPAGIVESCMEFLRICRRERFDDVVISIKASNTVVMVESVRLLVKAMDAEDMHYPLHLGVTEAGEGEDGRIKSAVGIGTLLTEGIGDTIRVSLSEEPEAEIPVARRLVELIGEAARKREEAEAAIHDDTLHLDFDTDDNADLQLLAAMTAGGALIGHKAHNLVITNHGERQEALEDSILQAARVRFTKPEYTSCPGCGRTLYNLQETVSRIKEAINREAEHDERFRTLRIAIMGCIVNGPGEMADADYGYVGAGPGRVSLYKQKTCVEKNIPSDEAVGKLLQLIRSQE
ncbi:MAG: (E)-4-hydroxy-3-methylbut-2-enyl-diphosphate synthase [Bacteroidales bacterium]|nr:(E)-4-hydroxy-3-methylbut-2-enyl-diphosphate synthase [Bacteroidales bacterium]MDY5448430.1 (E)-4-hydroxy-3-methylbut-2-enyl-diphosphate synthase [Prevotella sp.]